MIMTGASSEFVGSHQKVSLGEVTILQLLVQELGVHVELYKCLFSVSLLEYRRMYAIQSMYSLQSLLLLRDSLKKGSYIWDILHEVFSTQCLGHHVTETILFRRRCKIQLSLCLLQQFKAVKVFILYARLATQSFFRMFSIICSGNTTIPIRKIKNGKPSKQYFCK